MLQVEGRDNRKDERVQGIKRDIKQALWVKKKIIENIRIKSNKKNINFYCFKKSKKIKGMVRLKEEKISNVLKREEASQIKLKICIKYLRLRLIFKCTRKKKKNF